MHQGGDKSQCGLGRDEGRVHLVKPGEVLWIPTESISERGRRRAAPGMIFL